ncbi:hypothetical protein MKL09_07100 [Methylobacterium sp. J-048]|uniref:hypothetical protein n=1 Tax=Methylobacterium sp. J-048 TaxID=2836635 RepID=UPI001FBA664F|nr:hypothetical protein [Methylobacterium sp. J-048]MCJ2056314.1 hypothetical protein [Methylobacterium sp. J-048]
MTITRQETAENVAFWRRVLNKPEPTTPERKLTQAERMAAWSAQNRRDEAAATQTRESVGQSAVRHVVDVPPEFAGAKIKVTRDGRSYDARARQHAVGAEHRAHDQSVWRRVA